MPARRWTTPDDIAFQLRRRWDEGDLLVRADGLFPLRLPVRGPAPPEIGRRLPEVQAWAVALQAGSRSARGQGYDLEYRPVTSRQLGTQRLPSEAIVPTLADALSLISCQDAHARWRELALLADRLCPALALWVQAHPIALLDHAEAWERALRVVAWFLAHPRSGLHLRQIDIPGVDTKFIERQNALLGQLLDAVLPADGLGVGSGGFAERYGLRSKPSLIQVRILDPRLAIGGLTHLAAPLEQWAGIAPPVQRVIITENEINGLTLPAMDGTATVFGRGYAVDRLADIPWIAGTDLHYWGDIDTHGFAILDRLRARVPHARSLLMDEATLLTHRELWGLEPSPATGPLHHLTPEERALHDGLIRHRWSDRVRLEQERIGYRWVEHRLDGLRS
jgi:hypothetical protein